VSESPGIPSTTRRSSTAEPPELEAAWFQECQLLFHEVDLVRPRSVHSYYPEVLSWRGKWLDACSSTIPSGTRAVGDGPGRHVVHIS